VNLLQSRFTKQLFLLFILLSLFSCTLTTTKPKQPHFVSDTGAISADIGRVIVAEEIVFAGSEIKTNGHTTSELAITIVNAANLPKDQEQCRERGEQIAHLLKQALKDPDEYDAYKVIFLFERSKGVITTSESAEFYYPSGKL